VPDIYADIASADRATQERLATAMEVRAAEPRQREILETYLGWIDWPENARVLEVGCGTGAITRVLARRPASQPSWASILRRYFWPRHASCPASSLT
jgi:phospholipid N-methyltransferase